MQYFTYFKKTLTFVTLVGSTVGLTICLRKCLTFFLEEPSYTDISMVDQQNAIFPVVTFCPEPKSKYKVKEDILKAHGIASGCEYYEKDCNLTWTSSSESVSPQDLFDKATYGLEDMLDSIQVRLVHPINNTYTHRFNATYLEHLDITEQRRRSHLRCWTIGLNKILRTEPVYYISFYMKMPLAYHLHKDGQFLNVNGRMSNRLNLNTKVRVQVSAWDMYMREDEPENQCESDTLTFDDCLYTTLEREMRTNTKGNCTVPWTRDNSRICNDKEDIKAAFNISWTRGTNQLKDCKKPCHSLEISLIGDSTEKSSQTRLVIYFKTVVTMSVEKRLYTWRNLFAEIGGYVGMFMGWSFVSLSEDVISGCKYLYSIYVQQTAYYRPWTSKK